MNISISLVQNCEAGISCAPEKDFCKRNASAPAWYQIAGIAFFYLVILATGIYATKRGKKLRRMSMDLAQDNMVAGRNIGLFIGVFTMTATWVGGGYINATAQMVYSNGGGLLWTQAPFGYAISLALGGILFAEKMREKGYITMLDPFQRRFGKRWGGCLFFPALLGEVFWSAAVLNALGSTLSVIGGLYSVAFTDVIQLFCILIGLCVAIPYAATHDAVKMNPFSVESNPVDYTLSCFGFDKNISWLGNWNTLKNFKTLGQWTDSYLLLMFGGIPWQVYFQRVLSSDTAHHAKLLSFFAAAGCIIMSIPPIMIGAIARSTDWSETGFFETGKYNPEECGETDKILPIVLATLTPPVVSTIGLGAISAAVMSSADSSILSAASMFTHNIWSESISPGSSEKAVMRVMRVSIVTVGAIATVLAIKGTSVYSLWYLSGDIVYVTLFPQLLLVVHFEDRINARGSQIGLLLGVIIRAIGGDTGLNIPALVEFPGYDCKTNTQYFPFRSLAMIVTLLGCLVGSAVFADPHPVSEEEDLPFYKKGKSPIISSPAGGETIEKLRLEDAVFEEDENAPRNAE